MGIQHGGHGAAPGGAVPELLWGSQGLSWVFLGCPWGSLGSLGLWDLWGQIWPLEALVLGALRRVPVLLSLLSLWLWLWLLCSDFTAVGSDFSAASTDAHRRGR